MLSLGGGNDQEDSILFRESSAKIIYLQSFEDIYESEVSRQSAGLT